MLEIALSIGGSAMVGVVAYGFKKIHAHDTAISVLTEQMKSLHTQVVDGRAETRQEFRDVKESLDGLTHHILRSPRP